MARSFVFHIRPGLEIVPGYELITLLGDGAFGEVWESTAPGGGRAALKLIDLRDQMGVREYVGLRRVQNVRHANLVDVNAMFLINEDGSVLGDDEVAAFDARKIPSGATLAAPQSGPEPAMLVMAMSKAEKNLRKRLEECLEEFGTGIPEKELLGYMDQAARGIDHLNAAQHNIQHCDIKPENLVLFGDSVKICDFGIAKLVDNWAQTATEFPGTLYYMAPEMHESPPQPNSHTDQYSFACMYYLLRTSKLPFNDESSIRAITMAHCEGKLDLSKIQGKHETKVIRRATQLVPERRFGSAGEFVEALKEAIWNDGREAIDARRKARNRRIRSGMLGVLAAAGVGLMIYCASIEKIRGPIVDYLFPEKSEEIDVIEVEPFSEAIEHTKSLFKDGKWKEAFDECRTLAKKEDEYVSPAADWLDKYIKELFILANESLDKSPQRATIQFGVALAEAQSQSKSQLEHDALLGLARAAARNGEWDYVAKQLEPLKGHFISDQAALANVLLILQQTSPDASRFFEEQILVQVDKLYVDQQENFFTKGNFQWERDRFYELLDEALQVLESGRFAGLAEGDRLDKIFPGGLTVARFLQKALKDLLADNPPLPRKLKELHGQLEDLKKDASASVSKRIHFLSLVARIRNHDEELGPIWQELPIDVRDTINKLCEFLLVRLEEEALEAFLERKEVKSANDYLGRVPLVLDSKTANTFRERLVAIDTVQSVHDVSFDPGYARKKCDELIANDRLPNDRIDVLIKTIWAECVLIARDSNASDLRNAKQIAEAFVSTEMPPASSSYLDYVRAHASFRFDSLENAATFVERALQPEDLPAYFAYKIRGDLAAEILLSTAKRLRSNSNDKQIQERAFDPYSASSAKRLIGLLEGKLDRRTPESRRLLALATFYEGKDFDSVIRKCDELELSSTRIEDGQLLFAAAMSHHLRKPTDETRRAETIQAFSALINWCDPEAGKDGSRFRIRFANVPERERSKLYQEVIKRAFVHASHYRAQIIDFDSLEPTKELNVAAIPAALREHLARIFAARAFLVQTEFGVEKDEFDGDHTLAVMDCYHYFRAANALRDQQIEYVIGQCQAVLDWDERDYHDRVKEAEELAKKAIMIDPDHAVANLIMGRMLFEQSRFLPKQGRRLNLAEAIKRFKKASQLLQDYSKAECLVFESAAELDLSFLFDQQAEKKTHLKSALDRAKDAKAIFPRSKPQAAWMAIGNAAEDIAYYLREDLTDNYQQAVDAFDAAARECSQQDQPDSAALIGKARCRFRRAYDIYQSENFRPPNINVAEELRTCIKELEFVGNKCQSDRERAECFLWLGELHALCAVVTKSNSHFTSAETVFKKAIEQADIFQWVEIQYAWAMLAKARNEKETEEGRWQAILDERRMGENVVSSNHAFRAAEQIFANTENDPLKKRLAKLESLLKYFDEENAEELPHLVNLMLLFAYDFVRHPRTEQELTMGFSNTQKAWTLAKKTTDQQLKSQAAATLALLFRDRYEFEKKHDLLETAIQLGEEASNTMPNAPPYHLGYVLFRVHNMLASEIHKKYKTKSKLTAMDKLHIGGTVVRLQNWQEHLTQKQPKLEIEARINALKKLLE